MVPIVYDRMCIARRPVLTQQQMEDYGIPLASRDECAHVLVKLEACRTENFSLPWKCVEKRNAYFRCEEKEYDVCIFSVFCYLLVLLLLVCHAILLKR